jgi:predicted dehydrogenase
MTIRIGLVGSGYMAKEYLKASSAVETLKIVSIFSRNVSTATSLASEFNIPMVAQTVEEFAELKLDFLLICVPELATGNIISSFSKLNLPMLVEKPVGLTLPEALEIENFAATRGLSIFVALNRRFYSSSMQVFAELSSSTGKRVVRVNDQENTIAAISAGQPTRVVENWMFANSIHIIDFVSIICRGEPSIQFKRRTALDDLAYVVHVGIEFTSGDEALYTCYWNSPSGWSVDINTSSRAWQLSPLEVARVRKLEDRQFSDFVKDDNDLRFKPGLVQMLIELEKCVNGQEHKLTTISEANRTMRLIEMIYANE